MTNNVDVTVNTIKYLDPITNTFLICIDGEYVQSIHFRSFISVITSKFVYEKVEKIREHKNKYFCEFNPNTNVKEDRDVKVESGICSDGCLYHNYSPLPTGTILKEVK